MPTITQISPMPRKKQRCLIFLDEEASGSLHRASIQEEGLIEGCELTWRQWGQILLGPELRLAKSAALYALGRHGMTRKEVIDYLIRIGYHEETAQAAAESMEEYGYVQDREVASSIVTQRAAQGKGRREITQKLRQRGIDSELADEALESYTEEEEAKVCGETAAQLLHRYEREEDPQKRRDKLAQALMRRGFSWTLIDSTIRRLLEDDD